MDCQWQWKLIMGDVCMWLFLCASVWRATVKLTMRQIIHCHGCNRADAGAHIRTFAYICVCKRGLRCCTHVQDNVGIWQVTCCSFDFFYAQAHDNIIFCSNSHSKFIFYSYSILLLTLFALYLRLLLLCFLLVDGIVFRIHRHCTRFHLHSVWYCHARCCSLKMLTKGTPENG